MVKENDLSKVDIKSLAMEKVKHSVTFVALNWGSYLQLHPQDSP